MSALVLLNLLNGLEKMMKGEACRAFYRVFETSLINSIKTGARMFDSIYHLTLTLLLA